MIDILMLGIVALVVWCVASESAWDAAITCLCVIFSGLLAMNFFEPLANFLENTISSSFEWQNRWDIIALVGLFAIFIFLLRMAAEQLSPDKIPMHEFVNNVGRWGCAALTGYVTMAFLMTALHTAPLPRDFISFAPEPAQRPGPLGSLAPDFQWLGFTQHVSEYVFRKNESGRIFDGPQFNPANPAVETANENNTLVASLKVWPSFPIRYATRRENFAKSGMSGGGGTQGGLIRRSSSRSTKSTSEKKSGGKSRKKRRRGPGF